MKNMDSTFKAILGVLIFGIAITRAIPIDDGGLKTFMKTQSFSSSMSNINGDKHEQSYFKNGAELNGNPIYLMRGENHDDNDDVREALDVLLPQENIHKHLDSDNGQESSYEEPLIDESEDYDYPQLKQLVDDDVLVVPTEYSDDYSNGEDNLNDQADEETIEDYYDQLLKNLI